MDSIQLDQYYPKVSRETDYTSPKKLLPETNWTFKNTQFQNLICSDTQFYLGDSGSYHQSINLLSFA